MVLLVVIVVVMVTVAVVMVLMVVLSLVLVLLLALLVSPLVHEPVVVAVVVVMVVMLMLAVVVLVAVTVMPPAMPGLFLIALTITLCFIALYLNSTVVAAAPVGAFVDSGGVFAIVVHRHAGALVLPRELFQRYCVCGFIRELWVSVRWLGRGVEKLCK